MTKSNVYVKVDEIVKDYNYLNGNIEDTLKTLEDIRRSYPADYSIEIRVGKEDAELYEHVPSHGFDITITIYRLETDEERVIREELEAIEEVERREYERLKKKFE